MVILKKIIRYVRILLYQRTHDKKLFDYYIKRIRRLQPLNNSEWAMFQLLGEREKKLYGESE